MRIDSMSQLKECLRSDFKANNTSFSVKGYFFSGGYKVYMFFEDL